MAQLLRSEIQVAILECRENFLARQVVEQINDSFQEQRHGSRPGADDRRLALRLPLDQVSDDEVVDSSDWPYDDMASSSSPSSSFKRHHRSCIEISPTDSAFHSDDVSPECSRYDGPLLSSAYSDLALTPNGCGSRTSDYSGLLSTAIATGSGDRSVLGGLLGDDFELLRSAGSHLDVDYAALHSQPWWDSNWSLHSGGSYCSTVAPAIGEKFTPLVIPVADVTMRPKIGAFDIDDISELSEVRSVRSFDTYSSADSESTLEDLSFLEELKDCRIGAGQVARFRCQLLSGRAVTVTWHHGNKMIENGGRYRIYRNGTKHSLEIYFTTFADSGAVWCRAIGVDCVAEASARLRIRESRLPPRPPEFVYKPDSIEVLKGDDVELCCKVKGQPVPVLTWFLNGRKVTGMDIGIEVEHIGKEEWLLLIEGKRLLSSCTVRCLASNPLGESVCSASILVVVSAGAGGRELPPNVDGKLAHLDRKLAHATTQVLDSAEQMLSDATQMASLNRQLKVVDTYLDRIEAKFRQTDHTTPIRLDNQHSSSPPPQPPPQPSSPPQLSLIQVTFPPRDDTSSRVSLPSPPSERSTDPPHQSGVPTKPQSVSITVLSKHVESDRVRVVFKQSFQADDTTTTSPSAQPTGSASNVSSMGARTDQPPKYPEVTVGKSSVGKEPLDFPKGIAVGEIDDYSNPYLPENLTRRIAENKRAASYLISVPATYEPASPPDYRRNTGAHARDFVTGAGNRKSGNKKGEDRRREPEILFRAEDTVNRTTDRLRHLDNRVDIIQTDLLTTSDYRPEDLRRLESAVSLTASEIQATERTIKQVESLVTHLQQTSSQQQRRRSKQPSKQQHSSSRQSEDDQHAEHDDDCAFGSPPLVTYSTMSASPQDFPQDGVPSVKSLLSRFQSGRQASLPEKDNSLRRIGSTASEDGSSDISVTSSPDNLERKPLPVFNKAKFQENIIAARSGQKPRIQASITARSLSREMREQLSISRPQMGAFRSNIMTPENGEYDPKRALKAKELFIAESAHEHEHQDSHKNGSHHAGSIDKPATNGNSNGHASNGHHHRHEIFEEEAEEEVKTPAKGPKIADLPLKHSKNVEYDSLDEESEGEPQYAKVSKKNDTGKSVDTTVFKARAGSSGSSHHEHEDSSRTPVSGTPVAAHKQTDKDSHSLHSRKSSSASSVHEEIGKDASRSRKSSTSSSDHDDKHHESADSGAGSPEAGKPWSPPQHDEDENIPLSQAPNWDLLI